MSRRASNFWLLVAALLLGIAFLIAGKASAQDASIPRGLGHPSDHQSYFDGNCCNKSDCEMIPDNAISETADGWRVRYWTNNWGGRVVEGFIKRGQERMSKRCSPDGFCTGACSIYPGPDPNTPAAIRCLYIMPSA